MKRKRDNVYACLLADLCGLNFGTEDDISGADTVDIVNQHWPAIEAAPALLDAAEAFLAFFRKFDGEQLWQEINAPGVCPPLANLQAAIARAKGEA